MRNRVFAFVGSVLFISNIAISQTERLSGSVVYESVWTTTYPIQAKGVLCFNQYGSSFMAISDFTAVESNGKGNDSRNENLSMVETAPGQFSVVRRRDPNTLKESKSIPFNIFTVKENSKIYQLVNETYFANKKKQTVPYFYLEEEVGRIEWIIESETKTIGSFQCQKATCKFRGRDYIAWFTPEIPITYGPWKLHGLPGLIVQVADIKNEVIFSAVEINIGNVTSCNIAYKKEYPVYTLREYITSQRERVQNESKRLESNIQVIQARQPEDIGFNVSSFKVHNVGLELEYEF
ncbi:GLPGLI family protein [Tenuifilum sp.]|uniref:GLPGLI family protein n=1 Tax=Tenuifilum sp. TaxID=2760880 RepID=UPI002B81B7A9|nr:GLPGLI family protein [Tenuifilum sp.]HOK85525.1 GLPGLI family protein [Tenuifilum sp.]HON69663.1 GLPGLI family protein [Tenuifilum sp.]HPP89170.1 GLPGLI family protein [Tenuifilum sp.]